MRDMIVFSLFFLLLRRETH